MTRARVLEIPAASKRHLRVMLLAKHARSDGRLDREDGSHAIYHHELRSTLEAIGLRVEPAVSYDAVIARPDCDFVVALLNRGGFQNSEMLAPLLLTKHGIPYLGASPIVRGLADDKHLNAIVAEAQRIVSNTVSA